MTRPDPVTALREQAKPDLLDIRLWDPSSQLRFAAKRTVPPRPDGAPNRGRERKAA